MKTKVTRQIRKKIKYLQKNKLKDMQICDLIDREFRIAVLKIVNKIQENTGSLMSSEIKQ